MGVRGIACGLVVAAALSMAAGTAAQEMPADTDEAATPAGPAMAPEDVDALVARMREKLERMRRMAAERDEALARLREQVEKATELLGTSRETTRSLRAKTRELSVRLEELGEERARLESAMSERERLLAALESRVAALTDLLGLERPDRERLGDGLGAVRERLAAVLAERDRLVARVRELEGALAAREEALAAAREEGEATRRRLEEDLASLRAERERLAAEIARLRESLGARESEIRRLTEEVARLNRYTRNLVAALAESEQRFDEVERLVARQKGEIALLSARLNEALARKVEELQRYRSEFFGRLREVLGNHPDVRIVGDRFVLQAEILFPSGSAELEPEGRRRLERIAETLKEIAADIPPDIDWVLRVDGHTDRRPLRPDSPFRDNWELSTERANTVVRFLVAHGIPPEHLAAAGFGEFRPIDPRDTEEAYRRNRRIEFKLTAR